MSARGMAAICAFETFERRLESTSKRPLQVAIPNIACGTVSGRRLVVIWRAEFRPEGEIPAGLTMLENRGNQPTCFRVPTAWQHSIPPLDVRAKADISLRVPQSGLATA